MRAIYIDESGRGNDFYFFGALIVDDHSIRYIEDSLNSIGALVGRHVPGFDPAAEFHAVDMFHGKRQWEGVPLGWRVKACNLVSKVLARSGAEYVFRGIDLNKLRAAYLHPPPAHLLTLAQLLEDVDSRLARVHRSIGLALADDHHTANDSRRNLTAFKIASAPGYTQTKLTHFADTLYFGPSDESRLLQAADFATFFLNRSRTVQERDARAKAAVDRIASRIRSITTREYVWSPNVKRR